MIVKLNASGMKWRLFLFIILGSSIQACGLYDIFGHEIVIFPSSPFQLPSIISLFNCSSCFLLQFTLQLSCFCFGSHFLVISNSITNSFTMSTKKNNYPSYYFISCYLFVAFWVYLAYTWLYLDFAKSDKVLVLGRPANCHW